MNTEDTPPQSEKATIDSRRGDRRKKSIPVAVERRSGKDRRAQRDLEAEEGARRRQVDPTTCEKDYTEEEIEFMKAMDLYKRNNRRPFPTWSEVLEVIRSLGYRKVEAASPIPGVPVARREQ
ncbi:MAG: hypothetical protein SNJ75_10565 [Gemmataceae bacterium]